MSETLHDNDRKYLEHAMPQVHEYIDHLEAQVEALQGIDIRGLKMVATEMAKSKPPFTYPSLWRDAGLRQRQIGEQLLRLCAALLESEAELYEDDA